MWKEGGQMFGGVCSWARFLSHWGEEYPNLKVQKPGEDTCELCYQFHLRNRLGKGANYCLYTAANLECVVLDNDTRPEDDDEDDDIPLSKAVAIYKKKQDTIDNCPLSEVITEQRQGIDERDWGGKETRWRQKKEDRGIRWKTRGAGKASKQVKGAGSMQEQVDELMTADSKR
jgi:hypothetical protein